MSLSTAPLQVQAHAGVSCRNRQYADWADPINQRLWAPTWLDEPDEMRSVLSRGMLVDRSYKGGRIYNFLMIARCLTMTSVSGN